jgi:hypothetical protein
VAIIIPYVKQTHTVSGTWTAAKANVVEDGVNDAHFQPAVSVFHNTTQSLTSGTEASLAFNSERFDTAGNVASTQHDNATNNSRLTCRYAGKYQVSAHVEIAANATGIRYIAFRVNGTASQYIGQATLLGSASLAAALNLSSLIDLAVNDYVEVRAFQNSGGALNVTASSSTIRYAAEFMMVRVA